MEGREWPCGGMRGEAVFDWVEMDVVHVCAVIALVADRVFPEAVLPEFATIARRRSRFAGQSFGEAGFDGAPAAGIIGIVFRQGPDAVHVIGEDDPRVDVKRGAEANRADGGTEGLDLADQKVGAAVGQVYREEIGSSGDAVAAVAGHWGFGFGVRRMGAAMAEGASLFRPTGYEVSLNSSRPISIRRISEVPAPIS